MGGAYRTSDSLASARKAVAVTKSDVTVIPVTRALYIGGAGNVSLRLVDDSAAVMHLGVPAGTILSVQAVQVMDATTATGIVAWY